MHFPFSMILAVQDSLILGISLWQPVIKVHHLPLTDLQQCQSNHSPTQSYLKEQLPELQSSSSSSQPRTKGPGPSHMNLCPWVHGCDRQQWQCYWTVIKSSRGAASFFCCPTSKVLCTPPQSVVPTPCEFYKILPFLSHAKQVIWQTQLCLQLGQTQVRTAKFWCFSQSIQETELLLQRGQKKDKQVHSYFNTNHHFKQIQLRGCWKGCPYLAWTWKHQDVFTAQHEHT